MLPLLSPEELRELDSLLSSQPIDAEVAPDWFHEGQREAWLCTALEVCIIAGAQGGKTAFLAYWLLREIQRTEPFFRKIGFGVALYVGPTMELLKGQAIPAFVRLFEDELRLGTFIGGGKPYFRFSEEGCKKVFGHSDFPMVVRFAYANDSSNLESVTAGCGVWDEAGQKENKQASFEAYDRRLSAARASGYGRRCWGSTPYEWNWFKTEVHDRAIKGELGFELIRFPTWMNPIQDREQIEAKKETMQPWKWRMFYQGEYTKPAGAIYDCFSDENKVKRHQVFFGKDEPPEEWEKFIGVDFGNVNTAAVKIAKQRKRIQQPDGTVKWGEPTGKYIVYGDYYPASNMAAKEHAAALLKGHATAPMCFGGSLQEDGWREAFGAAGLFTRMPSDGNVETQINCVYAGFASNDLLVCDDLDQLLFDIENYARELDDMGEPTEKIAFKSKWHRLDGLRYIGYFLFRDRIIQKSYRSKRGGYT